MRRIVERRAELCGEDWRDAGGFVCLSDTDKSSMIKAGGGAKVSNWIELLGRYFSMIDWSEHILCWQFSREQLGV